MKLYCITYLMMLPSNDEEVTKIYKEDEKFDFLSELERLKDSWYAYNIKAYKATSMEPLDIDKLLNF